MWDEAELDAALGLSDPEQSPQPSPLSDRSSGFRYEIGHEHNYELLEREGSPRRRRPPSKRRAARTPAGAPQQQQQLEPELKQPRLAEPQPCGLCVAPVGAVAPSAAQQQHDADCAAAPAAASAPPAGGECPLQALPLQLLLRLLSFLSAQDLAAAARASALLRSLSDEPVLWRRLFCARWGKPRGPQQQQLPPKTWKARYVERDLAELAEARARAPQLLGFAPTGGGVAGAPGGACGSAAVHSGASAAAGAPNMFVEAQLAKRQRALGRAHVDDPMEVTDDVARRVEAWRAARGFAPLARAPGGGAAAQQPAPAGQQQREPGLGGRGGGAQVAASGCVELGEAPHPTASTPLGGSDTAATTSSGSGGGRPAADAAPQARAGGGAGRLGAGAQAAGARGAGEVVRIRGQQQRPRAQQWQGEGPQARPPQGEQQRQRQQQQQQQQDGGGQPGGRAAVHRWCRVAGTGNVYCCEVTGDVHVCDDTCTEHELERGSGLLVCPISGTVRDDLRSVCGAPCEGEEEEEEAAAALDGDFGGRLARAFEMGYYAESLEELERTCFVPRHRRG